MTRTPQPQPDLADKLIKVIGTTKSLIVHTCLFVGIFSLAFFGISLDKILLVLTTFLSIEAIYLAIFIQISVNKNTESLEEVEQDIDEIEHDIDEIQEDVIEEDEHDKEVKKTLLTIEKSLKSLQAELEVLHKKGLGKSSKK